MGGSMFSPRRRSGSALSRPPIVPGARRKLADAAARAVVESVERRLSMDGSPKADIGVGDITAAGGSAVTVSITYTGERKIRVDTVGSSDVTVVREDGLALSLEHVSVAPTSDSAPV